MKELDICFAGAILPQEQDTFLAFLQKEDFENSAQGKSSKNHPNPLVERKWTNSYRPHKSFEKTCDVFGKNGRGAMLIWWADRYKGTRHPGLMYLRFPKFKFHCPVAWADNALGFTPLFSNVKDIEKGQVALRICQLIADFPPPSHHKTAHEIIDHSSQWKKAVQDFKKENSF